MQWSQKKSQSVIIRDRACGSDTRARHLRHRGDDRDSTYAHHLHHRGDDRDSTYARHLHHRGDDRDSTYARHLRHHGDDRGSSGGALKGSDRQRERDRV